MSILIKGIDLPKEGEDITLEINHKGEVRAYSTKLKEVDTDLQATQIPTPHGDLIDRDIVRDECYKAMGELMQSTTINMSAEALSLLCGFTIINDAPTIIEAEE